MSNNMNNDDDELYDEFGNYIGPDLDSSSDDDDDDDDDDDNSNDEDDNDKDDDDDDDESMTSVTDQQIITTHNNNDVTTTSQAQNQIILHEDKIHYPSAETIYGPNVTTAVLDEDTMDIETPIIPPSFPTMTTTTATTSSTNTTEMEQNLIKDEYLVNLLDTNMSCSRSRGIVICGKLQCGKSSFIDLLRSHTLKNTSDTTNIDNHDNNNNNEKYTHTLLTEQKHKMTISSTPLTLPLSNGLGQTYAFTMIDTPGHVQFHDEVTTSMKAMDGCLLLIDVVEGMTYMDEILLSCCIYHGLPIMIMIHKLDRLILDLKLPLNDAYMKIKHVLDDINVFIKSKSTNNNGSGKSGGRYPIISPLNGNVLFGCSKHGYVFSLESMVDLYMDHNLLHDDDDDDSDDDDGDENHDMHSHTKKQKFNSSMFGTNIFGQQSLTKVEFIKRLWGNTFYNPQTHTFTKKPTSSTSKRTFCTFILEPLYKLYGVCISTTEKELNKELRSLGIFLNKDQLRSDVHVLLNIVMRKFFGDCRSFVDMVVKNL